MLSVFFRILKAALRFLGGLGAIIFVIGGYLFVFSSRKKNNYNKEKADSENIEERNNEEDMVAPNDTFKYD